MIQFVPASSIVRKVWGTTDITLFIFAGAAAEFALNKEVDWLFFTGRLPADPIGRLFSTVSYAQRIIFNEERKANAAINNINSIHQTVETNRGAKISAAAYEDVLFMLIHYSIAAFEILERKLSLEEKDEMVATFRRIGEGMHMAGLPSNYNEWTKSYTEHLQDNLLNSHYTADLFRQYRKHLGWFRYQLLLEIQRLTASDRVRALLRLGRPGWSIPLLPIYRLIRKTSIGGWIIRILIPKKFMKQFTEMERLNRGHRPI